MNKPERELRRLASEAGFTVLGNSRGRGSLYDLQHQATGITVRCRSPADGCGRTYQQIANRLKQAIDGTKDAENPRHRLPLRPHG